MLDTKLTIAKNILYYRKLRGLSQKELATQIGVKHNTISSWEKSTNCVDIDSLFKISKILDVKIDTLFGVEDDSYNYKDVEYMRKYCQLDEHGKEIVDIIIDKELNRAEKTKSIIRYPVQSYYEPVSAGTGNILDYSTSCIYFIYEKPPKATKFMLRISGDSMSPTYTDGSFVYINTDETPKYGEVGVFIHDGSIYIKEYGKQGLISYNKNYDIIKGNETTICIGKVIGCYNGKVDTE